MVCSWLPPRDIEHTFICRTIHTRFTSQCCWHTSPCWLKQREAIVYMKMWMSSLVSCGLNSTTYLNPGMSTAIGGTENACLWWSISTNGRCWCRWARRIATRRIWRFWWYCWGRQGAVKQGESISQETLWYTKQLFLEHTKWWAVLRTTVPAFSHHLQHLTCVTLLHKRSRKIGIQL